MHLLIIHYLQRCRLFEPFVHLSDLRCLFFETCRESFDLLVDKQRAMADRSDISIHLVHAVVKSRRWNATSGRVAIPNAPSAPNSPNQAMLSGNS